MTYVRPSSLGVAEFCPRSADLSSQSGIGRSAVISSAWHAKLAGNDTLIGELHPDERKEVANWGSPTDAVYVTESGETVTLEYDSATKETHVQLFEGDKLLTEGTPDFYWVREVSGRRWLFLGDLKRSTWAIPDGPDCLQLAAYGHALCVKESCDGYTPGLWSGTDSEWTWGSPVDLTAPEALDLYLRIKRSARNDWRLMLEGSDKARYVTGSHCASCYGRQRCPEFVALSADGAEPEPNEENAAGLLLKARAMQDLADRLTANVKVFCDRGGIVKDPTTGKVFLRTMQKGRKSLDQDALKAAGVELEKFQKTGQPFAKYDWRKP